MMQGAQAGALWQPLEGLDRVGCEVGGRFKMEGTYTYSYVDPYVDSYVDLCWYKAIILQLKINKLKKN